MTFFFDIPEIHGVKRNSQMSESSGVASTAYSRVASTAIQLLKPFSSTWLCETCFLALLSIKNKARN